METISDKIESRGPGEHARALLPRSLGLVSAIAVLIGSTIGTGIFRSPAGIATKVPDEGLYLLLWALGGFFSLCGALTLAELAGALPNTGGVFVYLREGWGKLPAFLFGWSELTIIRASALGAVSTVFAEYLLRLFRVDNQSAVHYVAAGAILLVAVFNILGVQMGALVQNLTTGAKYGALVILVLAAFLIGGNDPAPVAAQPAEAPGETTLVMFGLAFISLLWVYDGWADVTFLSGEVKRPERNLPLTIIGGTLAVILIYLLANFAYLHLLDIKEIAGSKLVAADGAYRIIGETGVKLVSVAVMISAFGTLNGSMMTGPRIFFAMADDGLFFKKIASVHPRFKTPHIAISLAAALAIVFVMIRTFEQLADAFVLAIWPFYALGVAAVYSLRRKRPDLARGYRTWGYPVTPILFILAVLWLIGNAFVEDLVHGLRDNFSYYRALFTGSSLPYDSSGALLVVAIVLAGIPAYYIWNAAHSKPG
ncbi:MAG TPA: amino acid permease [Blastocatellia bacterium]|nr:amino acid permease [Blastocatellia bacterium]